MFRLLRYFSISSLVAILISAIALGMFYRHFASRDMLKAAEDTNLIVTQLFSNTLWPKYNNFLERASLITRDELLASPIMNALMNDVLAQMRGTSILKVKIFSLDAKTIFSTEKKQIGVIKDASYPGSISAKTKKIISKISHRDTFNSINGVLENRDVVSSYLPMRRSPNSKVEGVIEVYTDVTDLQQSIKRTQLNIILYVFLVLAFLYATLFLIVRHADKLIKRQYSELKQAEDESTRQYNELKKVNKKLHNTQSQLVQSEKMASVGQLAAGVAHEINNPIGFVNSNISSLSHYVKGLSKLLETYEAAEPQLEDGEVLKRIISVKKEIDLPYLQKDIKELIEESKEGLNRVKKIVEDLKDFSHVGSEEWEWCDLASSMNSTINIARNELKYKAEVIVNYDEIPEIKCQPSRLNQVFMNLLINAAHSIQDKGQVVVRISKADNNGILVEIQDTGSGIDPAHLNNIFDPFFTTKSVGTGTGLGLSLSYGIVKDHNGYIEVESEIGVGTTFKVWLPIQPV